MIPWINVKDMVPDAFVSVLVYMPGEAPLPTVHEAYYANGHWHWYYTEDLEDEDVTHWSPMPDGPEENNEY